MVYSAETVSLAVLENLVHMSRADFPEGYVVVTAVITDSVRVIEQIDLEREFGPADQRTLGDRWVKSAASAVLAVPSAVVPLERNFLLNPAHPDFRLIDIEPVVPFTFDERLFGG